MKKYLTLVACLLFGFSLFAAPPRKPATQGQKKKRVVERLDKGSFFQFGVGGGVSSLQYDLIGGNNHPLPSLNLHFGYTYYFNKTIGINTGLQYTTYASRAVMVDPLQWNGLTDYMGDQYNHIIDFNNWQERQAIHSLEIPLALSIKYKPKKVGLYSTLGLKIGAAVDQHYLNTRGTVAHKAYYPFWNVTMQNLEGRYETENYTGTKKALTAMHPINAIGYAEIGTLIELNPHTDLTIGAYADIYINNALNTNKINYQDMGFATRLNGYGSFMQPYNGIIGTTQASTTLRPWSAGLKIGISITPQRTDKEKERTAKRLYRKYKKYMPQCENDTVEIITHDTIYLHDTIAIPCLECALRMLQNKNDSLLAMQEEDYFTNEDVEIVEVVEEPIVYSELTKQQSQQLDSILQGAIIWFHFDEYVPILQPAYILDTIANMLLSNPELRVHVNGHACSIGSDSYNQKLALQRANAVADLLIEKGVIRQQLIVSSFGATEPFRYNGKHQLSTDRRVEIIPEIYGQAKIGEMRSDGVSELYTTFIGEEKIVEGMSLSSIARKWYNQREYWVYIFEANAHIIETPNQLPVGSTIMIPDLQQSIADSSESEMLRRARQLEKVYRDL